MTPKANGNTSLAEKVYGETLVVPGEFFPSNPNTDDVSLNQLRERAGKFTPCHKTYADKIRHFKPASLDNCPYVFTRQDSQRLPLSRPYKVSYRMLERMKMTNSKIISALKGKPNVNSVVCISVTEQKAFKIMVHGAEDWLTVDRLKPAHIEGDIDAHKQQGRRPPSASPEQTEDTRSLTIRGSKKSQPAHPATAYRG
ncbi:uncharacterized protein [Palaemon carinicauda]|uniref:uncharacterized protein n=1 Tax=Palaemon carinicauda TaxID=392227 RepID=UPI0035B578B4